MVAEQAQIDYERAEFINGEWIEKPMGTIEHSMIARRLVEMLRNLYSEYGRAEHEVTLKLGKELPIPDVVLLDWTDQRPLLCVEIRSPGQTIGKLMMKCEMYHAQGVPYCWVIDPKGAVWEYHCGSDPKRVSGVPCEETLTAGAITLDRADIETLFAPEEPPRETKAL